MSCKFAPSLVAEVFLELGPSLEELVVRWWTFGPIEDGGAGLSVCLSFFDRTGPIPAVNRR